MRARFSFSLLIAALLGNSPVAGQIVSYTFGPTTTPTLGANTVAANVSASNFASLTGNGTTSGTSPGSSTAGGGGGAYFTASNWRSADGNYFLFTLTPANGYQIDLTSISFYYASTGTGPSSASLTSSVDAYASSLGSFSLIQQAGGSLVATDWHLTSASITLSAINSATTFRLNATGASAAGGTLRVDAVTLNGSVTAVPEPSTYAAFAGAAALLGAMWHRRRQRTLTAKN